jgi:SAM-dependent methyltransferase
MPAIRSRLPDARSNKPFGMVLGMDWISLDVDGAGHNGDVPDDGPLVPAVPLSPSGGRQPPAGDANARTISAYDQYAQRYIDQTTREVTGAAKEWLDRAVAGVQRGARILELGSASGRDAAYLRDLGYQVRCTDATPAFVAALRARGIAASQLNAITDDLPGDLDVVLADAVLLHFTRREFTAVTAKVRRALRPGGRFAFTVKLGDGEDWSSARLGAPRFFCYWREPRVRVVLSAAGFPGADIRKARGRAGDKDWLHVVAAT